MSEPARHRRLAVLTGMALCLAAAWPWPVRPHLTIGAPNMEADNHLWMLWRAVQELTSGAGPWGNYPVGDPRPLMDLVHLPLAALAMPIDPAFAYGLVLMVDLALAAAGGWFLSRELGARPGGALVGMAVMVCAPFIGGAVVFGLSEAWPLGLFALFAAAFLHSARTGSLRSASAGAVLLAAFALSGWYNAFFAAVGCAVWVLVAWRLHRPSLRRWALLAGQGAVAVLLVLPVLVHFLRHGDAQGLIDRGVEAWVFQPDWRHATRFGTDPLNLFLPSLAKTELSRAVYLGVGALTLGAVALRTRREARLLAVGVLVLCLLALGHHATFGGIPLWGSTPPPAPAAWLTALVPPLQGIAHWYRAAGLAVVFLAPAAALGADVLLGTRPPVAALPLVFVVAVDGLLLADAPWPRPTYDGRPPDTVAAITGDGPLVLLPFDHGDRSWPDRAPRAYQRWQPWLSRPMAEHYEGPDALAFNPVLAWADRECSGGVMRNDRWPALPPHEVVDPGPVGAAADVQGLRDAGVETVALILPRASTPKRCRAVLDAYLGRPEGANADVVWWNLTKR